MMISRCVIAAEARSGLMAYAGFDRMDKAEEAELEFREVPYFIVSRSKDKWSEEQGDINRVLIVGAGERGLLVDPDNTPEEKRPGARTTLIPWTNIVSLTVLRSA